MPEAFDKSSFARPSNPITGWMRLPPLHNDEALEFTLVRDECVAGRPFVVRKNIGALITDVQVSPVFLGSTYPVGGFN
jgi:hypothetical protein